MLPNRANHPDCDRNGDRHAQESLKPRLEEMPCRPEAELIVIAEADDLVLVALRDRARRRIELNWFSTRGTWEIKKPDAPRT